MRLSNEQKQIFAELTIAVDQMDAETAQALNVISTDMLELVERAADLLGVEIPETGDAKSVVAGMLGSGNDWMEALHGRS